MPNDPYVVITPAGLNQLATYHEINVILRGVYKIFRTNPDIDLRGDGIMVQIHIVDGNIVCELVEDEPTEEVPTEEVGV